jgi:hypothetical protein
MHPKNVITKSNFVIFSAALSSVNEAEVYHDAVRPLSMDDLITSLDKMKQSKMHTGSFNTAKVDFF